MTRRLSWVAIAAGFLFFVAHVPFLTWFLDDIDAVNFALGVRYYDIAHHRPHPPGYPIFVFIGKVLTWLFTKVGWHPRGEIEAGALSFIGVVTGALAAVALVALFFRIERDGRRSVAAMLLTLASPLYWFTSARPLSDLPGLAMALVAQAVLAAAFVLQDGLGLRPPGNTPLGNTPPGNAPPGNGASGSADAAVGTSMGARTPAGAHTLAPNFQTTLASGQLIVLGAFLAGFAAGMRSQSLWLTVPLLALVIVDRVGRGAAGAILGSTITFGIGALIWFVPMVIATGGPAAYLHALSSQASEDFTGVDMLFTSARPVWRLAANLWQTFVEPWVSMPLAFVVLGLATIGFVAMVWRSRRGLVLLLGLWVPYGMLHLLFQENETTRYALPLVVPVAYLAVRGLDALTPRVFPIVLPIGAAALIFTSLAVGVPALVAYAPTRPPVFALFQDMENVQARLDEGREKRAAGGARTDRPERLTPASLSDVPRVSSAWQAGSEETAPTEPIVAMHRLVLTESRRAREWQGAAFPWKILAAPIGHEWLELVKYWREGGRAPIWFIADPLRTDLALIDPASRRLVRRYEWTVERVPADPLSQRLATMFPLLFQTPALVGGARPDAMDWYMIAPPRWFLGEGWALTPETSGIADHDKKGPCQPDGAVGYIRRRPEAARLVIGGRNLGAEHDPYARFSLDIDGRVLDTWDIAPRPGFFLRQILLPAGSLMTSNDGAGEFETITIRAQAVPGSGPHAGAQAAAQATAAPAAAAPAAAARAAGTQAGATPAGVTRAHAAVEQFDLQSIDDVMFGYDTGWLEDEFDPRTGLTWRWASDVAALRIWNGSASHASAGRDVHVHMRIESPMRYFATPPTIVLRVGASDIKRLSPRADFTIEADVPAALLAQAGGVVTLTTNEVFVPAERTRGSTDRRRLGLRVYDVAVTPK